MGTKSLAFDNKLEIARKIAGFVSLQNSDNNNELFDSALAFIGKTLKCNGCAVFGLNEADSFDLISLYEKKHGLYIGNMQKSVYELISDIILRERTYCLQAGNSDNIYSIPIKYKQQIFVLILSFKYKLDVEGVELLETIGGIFESAVEKLTLKQQLRGQYLSTVKSLVIAIEAKDVYTQGHSQRVARYSRIIGKHLKLKDEEIDELEITGLVHDIGKIGISDNLLTKPKSLTEQEFDSIKQHPEIGTRILKPLGVSENVMMGTLLHHKRYDLKGYPYNFEIDKLPLVPAIIGVADAFDAMTSERTYKKTISKIDALIELKRYKGTQFDPVIVDAMEEIVKSDII